jgi:hypothetical protein
VPTTAAILLPFAMHWGTYQLTDEPLAEPPSFSGHHLEVALYCV